MDWTTILTELIRIGIPTLATAMVGKKIKRQNNKHNARSNIMQLILEDKFNVTNGGLPENYQNILDEFDEYQASGGNSYIKGKVSEYIDWYDKFKKGGRNAKGKK